MNTPSCTIMLCYLCDVIITSDVIIGSIPLFSDFPLFCVVLCALSLFRTQCCQGILIKIGRQKVVPYKGDTPIYITQGCITQIYLGDHTTIGYNLHYIYTLNPASRLSKFQQDEIDPLNLPYILRSFTESYNLPLHLDPVRSSWIQWIN